MNGIKNIIFDFGGVVLNLDEHRTYDAMASLLQCSKQALLVTLHSSNHFFDFECGKISPQEFIQFIQGLAPTSVSSEQVVDAWNAMLLELPPAHVQLLLELKTKYRTFLLSNTNAIHEDCFVQGIQNQNIPYTLQDMFETVWYSHVLGMRKPNADIFYEVLAQAQLQAHETLFLDDRLDNIEAAKALGIHTIQVTKERGILSIFKAFE